MAAIVRSAKVWQLNDLQKKGCDLLCRHDHVMFYGGSRSGKTTLIVFMMILRAMNAPDSSHLVVRQTLNSVTRSIVNDTLPKVLAGFFPNLQTKLMKAPHYRLVIQCVDGGTATIWFGGLDSPEKILGTEYSTIYANECSEIDFDAIETLQTRLAENAGLSRVFIYDCNPPSKKHWSYIRFLLKQNPESKEACPFDSAYLQMNPTDNPTLDAAYIEGLKALSHRKRKRFLEGEFYSDIEGALWLMDAIYHARRLEPGKYEEVVIGVDPAVTNNENSDETGIIVAARDEFGQGVVIADLSGKYSTHMWAQIVINAYHKYNANTVVVETNQGGDLITDVLHQIDRAVYIRKIHAKHGKFARAEPVSALYECADKDDEVDLLRRGTVCHLDVFDELETEMTEWIPFKSKRSPNRIDALVYALTHLLIDKPRAIRAFVLNPGDYIEPTTKKIVKSGDITPL